jgi:hypothetical protein
MSHRTVAGVAAVSQTVQGWEFRPTLSIARLQFALMTWGAGVWVLIGLAFWAGGGATALAFFGLPIALFVAQLLAHGVSGWRLRTTPLVIEPGGRVRYGDGELCPPGSVESIRVMPDPLSEADGHRVHLGLAGGSAVELPRPYFESFLTRDHALQFAGEIARALNVGVVEPA